MRKGRGIRSLRQPFVYWNILYVDDGEWIVDDADDLMQSARMSKAGEN